MMISESQYSRRQNKAAYTRIDCPKCTGGWIHRGVPYPTACRSCEQTGYAYVLTSEVFA